MNCREFAERWDDLLDARSAPMAELEQSLEAHASSCLACRAVSSRYQVLRQAMTGLRPPPPASAASIERLYALTVPSKPMVMPIRRWSQAPRCLVPAAAAAAAFVLIWFDPGWWPSSDPAVATSTVPDPIPTAIPSLTPRRDLGMALADATEATIDLALEVSAPASRIGREVLDLRRETGTDRVDASETGLASSGEVPGLLRSVGQRVGAGVKPISGSARYAFSFLLGPPGDVDPAPPKRQNNL